jgi:hypothetical protein
MSANNPTNPRRFAAATLLIGAGAIAASLIGPTSVANAQGPQLYPVKGYTDCVDKAESISVPGHDDHALRASCCGSSGGTLVGPGDTVCASTQNTAGATKAPGAVTTAGHGPDLTRLAN